MIALIVKDLEVHPDEIIAASYEISTTVNFDNIVVSSIEDTVNKDGILINEDLDPSIKYYSRYKLLLKETGWTYYSNVRVLSTELHGYMNQKEDIPSRVSTPILSTSAKHLDAHPVSYFNFKAEGFDVVGGGRHTSTIYMIEDAVTSDIVWVRMGEEIEKTDIHIDDILLEDNKIYRLRAVFISSTGDYSQMATCTIKTGTKDIELLTPENTIVPNKENLINILDVKETSNTGYIYKVFVAKEQQLIEVYSGTGGKSHTLPIHAIKDNAISILRVENPDGKVKDTQLIIF